MVACRPDAGPMPTTVTAPPLTHRSRATHTQGRAAPEAGTSEQHAKHLKPPPALLATSRGRRCAQPPRTVAARYPARHDTAPLSTAPPLALALRPRPRHPTATLVALHPRMPAPSWPMSPRDRRTLAATTPTCLMPVPAGVWCGRRRWCHGPGAEVRPKWREPRQD